METGFQNQEEQVQQNLRRQLALAVRSIQWSYSIFWSISPSEPGELEWSEGYYNGEIKTRKTVQAEEFSVDQVGLQRSDKLRELYESLLAGETNPQARRPSASLSPEDLSNTEWYYLVCMSFVFNLGQGLPGRALEIGQPIWLCNAHQMDSKVFSRSLLAKSASIQTVVCFPFLGGVIELGITDMVLEDLSLIQYVEATLLGIDCPAFLQRPMLESPDESSLGFGLVIPVDETDFMVEGVNGELMDDELSNGVYNSMPSSECTSQNLMNFENPTPHAKIEVVDEICPQEQDIQDHYFKDDLHYKNVLSTLFKNNDLILEPCANNHEKESCFVRWRKGNINSNHKHTNGSSKGILKKILTEVVPRMYDGSSVEHKLLRPENDEFASNHVVAEKKRRETVNDKFSALKSLIPSVDKVDKELILDDTINHLRELKRRIEELETSQELDECNKRKIQTRSQDMSERTSESYHNNKAGVKRKADEGLRQSSTENNLSISLTESDVLIELRCPSKECLLLEIIDALSSLKLDAHSVESSTSNSFLSLTIKAKIKGFRGVSAGKIRQVLQRVVMKAG